ncbi:hypothetical protein L1987_75079 [Smallanthus sonchifolius]|uniref:Uncharacterized protein n=1 Tax=Smallanthus sonchifolius TaxID=185202 RepID=A0ACB9A5G9_9ASTR|nr:hypothetical protein L1987_75079 [Smallanthus sonchifolius]
MNTLSINIRGFGVEKKAKWIRDLRVAEKVSFVAFQETNRANISDMEIGKFWGRSGWKMDFVNPTGRSGGLLSVWDPGMFSLSSVVKDPNFLITSGFIKGETDLVNIVNIYAPQKSADKRALWGRLLAVKSAGSGLWLMAGDFNVVRRVDERKNSRFKPQCAIDFNSFVADADLYEYDLKGGKFTFMACLRTLPRVHSDHNPLLLVTCDLNFGAKPFRFFSSWLERPDFEKVVESAIGEFIPSGPPDLMLIRKFRFLRHKIRSWRDEIRTKEGELEENAKAKLEELDLAMENSRRRRIGFGWSRARTKWALEGDDNTAFFHGVINGRKSSNAIHGFNVNNHWISKPKKLKKLVFDFFRDKFKEDAPTRPFLEYDNENRISDAEAAALIDRFSKEEIKQAVFDCGSERAPGPDGFNMKFIKRFWRFFEEDFIKNFDNFFENGSFSRGTTSSFIALIPKEKDPVSLGNYRPINLIGIINKVVSKALANRLKVVIDGVISANQTAFLKDRLIMDGPLILNEFIMLMMDQLGFPHKWCLWIYGILSSVRSSVLVNGSPTFEFPCYKGMRQGDPISPFLFLIVMEGFSSMVRKASRSGVLRGIMLPNNGPILTHLLYADDCVLLGEWSGINIKNMALLLCCFYIVSGMQINMGKSSLIGIGVSSRQVESMAMVLNCKTGAIPFIHLGVMVGARMSRVENWKSVLEVVESRLTLWKAATLSVGGRVTLIKSVLESIPNYHMSIFKAPVAVLNGIEGIIRRFLWGGNNVIKKTHWVAWERVTAPIKMGGLGLSKLKEVNTSLLCKWIWRYKSEDLNLWKQVINSIHGSNRSWNLIPVNKQINGVWKSIVAMVESIKVGNVSFFQNIKGVVGNGRDIQFWIDPWTCNRPLKEMFPALFRLETNKRCLVFDRYDRLALSFSNKWEWRRWPSTVAEVSEWDVLVSMLQVFSLTEAPDRWEWIGGDQADFSVKAVKNFLRSDNDYSSNFVFKWSKWVPKKCNIFIWRAEMGRIATVDALRRRNCFSGDSTCVLCDDFDESADHLLCACSVASNVWSMVSRWCRVSPIFAFSVRDLLSLSDISGLGEMAKEAFQGILIVGVWCIWRARNNKRFTNTQKTAHDIFLDIKSLGFLWYRNRSKNKGICWANWCYFNLM